MRKISAMVLAALGASAQGSAMTLADCTGIADDQARLACYDSVALSVTTAATSASPQARKAPAAPDHEAPSELSLTSAPAAEAGSPDDVPFIPTRLRQEKAHASNRFVIIPHHRNYLLPLTYNSNINETAWDQSFPGTSMDRVEAKFQVSLKAMIWEAIFGQGIDLWGAYTQENWMQAYNTDASSPFRETDYQPELILSIDNDWSIFGFHNNRLDISLNHQSNGRSEPQSRSWNRLIGSALFDRKNYSLRVSAWHRLPERNKDDDNPDIDNFVGRAELQGIWKWPDYSVGFIWRNNLESNNRGSIQIDWTFPLSRRFQGYIQYFNGYGESLIDYDESTNRIGIGVSLTDPL